MEVGELLAQVRDVVTVKRVFGEPYEKDGTLVIPVAAVRGGAGGGTGEQSDGQKGTGAGLGMGGRPVGVYQVKADQVTWIPALDVTRMALMGQVVFIVMLLVARSMLRIATGRKR